MTGAQQANSEGLTQALAGIAAIVDEHGIDVEAALAAIGDRQLDDSSLRTWAKAIGDSATYWQTTAQAQLDAARVLGPDNLRDRLHRANTIARDRGVDVADAAVEILWSSRTDGRVFRFSRLALHLDARQQSAIDRAIEAAKATGRGDAATLKSVAAALKSDGFDDYLTADGFLRITVLAARTGVQYYSDGVETWGELRTEDEVGHPESIASWGIKPVTDDHPPVLVTPDNYTRYAKGSCGQDAELTPAQSDGNRYIKLTILVGDLSTLVKIRRGKLELSAGYTAVMLERPGRWGTDEYRYLQTQIRINHLAIVEAGRAGPLARISLDGSAYEVAPQPNHDDGETNMTINKDSHPLIRALISDAATAAKLIGDVDPEAIGALAEAIKAALTGSELPAELKEKLMVLLELSAEDVAGMMAPNENDEETEETEAVELADGLTVQLTKDQATAWRKHKDELDAKLKTLDSKVATLDAAAKEKGGAAAELKQQIADLRGENVATKRQLERLTADMARRERDDLIAEVQPLCPKLASKWAKDSADGKHTLSITDMKAAAIIDLDPGARPDIDRERGEQTFDAFVGSLYRSTIRGARERVAASKQTNDSNDQQPRAGFDDLQRQIAAATYGVTRN